MAKKFAILLNDYQVDLMRRALINSNSDMFNEIDREEISTLINLYDIDNFLIEYKENNVEVNDFSECYLDNIEG